MFEIGSALREARERRGLSYSQVEEGTKIRARYIRALEDEDFGVLPGATYSKGFLRAYADYLGLDGHLFIDEFNSRYHDPRNDDDRPIYPPSRRTPSRHRRETSIVLIALAAIVAIASLVFLGAGSGGTPNTPLPTPLDDAQPQDRPGFDRVIRRLVAVHHELEEAQAGLRPRRTRSPSPPRTATPTCRRTWDRPPAPRRRRSTTPISPSTCCSRASRP